MKIKQKKKMMLGDLITAAPKSWGAGRGRLVIHARPVVVAYSEQPQYSISLTKGRFI